MLIALDMDGVLADLFPALVEYHNTVYGTDVRAEDAHKFELEGVFGITVKELLKRLADFCRSDYADRIRPVPGAVKAVEALSKEHKLVIITARQEEFSKTTEKWIENHFPGMISRIYYTNGIYDTNGGNITKKDICKELGVDIFIEDALHNALGCAPVVSKVILLAYNWNNHDNLPENVHRVNDWEGILRKIDSKKERL